MAAGRDCRTALADVALLDPFERDGLRRLLLASDTAFTVTVMEPGAVEGYVEDVVALLRPALFVHARSWEHLGLVAPAPEELAQQIAEHWRAIRDASVD